jgi:hypothetical protein
MRKNQATKEQQNPIVINSKLFEQFAKAGSDIIDQDNMIKFFEKLKIAIDDPLIGYLMFIMQCKNNAQISR